MLRNMGAHGALTMKPTKLFGNALGALVLYYNYIDCFIIYIYIMM